jgi:tryptophan synthase alpha chain
VTAGGGAIAAAFARARAERRAAFVPYLTAGDPDLETTGELLLALDRAGADVVELGVPFSDPIADGPVNQAAAARALAAGTTLAGVLARVAALRGATSVPIVLFTYFNPLHAYGLERLAEHAAASGVDGVLCVDLPPEEAAGTYLGALERAGVDPIFLLAPTSTGARRKAVARAGRGFVYYVSRTGVTGERAELPRGLAREVAGLARKVGLPVAVGFGISTPEQVARVARLADGVVVGSALVRLVEEHAGSRRLVERVEARAAELARAARRGRGAR